MSGRGGGGEPGAGDVVVRDATDDDVERIVSLLAGGAVTAREVPADLGPYREALAEITATPGSTVLVAEVDGRVVGTCQLFVLRHIQEQGGRCAEVESVHVDADLRGRGIGGVLMAEVERRSAAAGCYRVQLTSNAVRTDAHRFYERLGYRPSHVGFKKYLDRR